MGCNHKVDKAIAIEVCPARTADHSQLATQRRHGVRDIDELTAVVAKQSARWRLRKATRHHPTSHKQIDVAIVIGANDVVNPGAETDESSPIYGMPVIQVWKAETTVVLKRSLGAGYAGVGNPLFYEENNKMLLGDAKDSMAQLMALLN